jgi:hypothetical protein
MMLLPVKVLTYWLTEKQIGTFPPMLKTALQVVKQVTVS